MTTKRCPPAARSLRGLVMAACLLGTLAPDGRALPLGRQAEQPAHAGHAARAAPPQIKLDGPIHPQSELRRLEAQPQPPLQALAARLGFRASKRISVTLEAAQFGKGLRQGTQSPLQTLRRLADASLPNSAVARRWLETPADMRLFVIAAREDSALVKRRTEEIRAAGGDVFFYRHCEPLCDNELVGAMLATAALVDVSTTLAAMQSEYVRVEAALAAEHRGLGPMVTLVPAEVLLAALEQAESVARQPAAAASAAAATRRFTVPATVYQARVDR